MAKKKLTRGTTPLGVAVFPWLNRPSTKFNPDGVYSCDIRLEGEDAVGLLEKLQAEYDTEYAKMCKEQGKKSLKKSINLPWKPVEDDEGNEVEGAFIIKIKNKAKVVTKKGDEFDLTPAIFDAKGKPVKDVEIRGGSKVKVAYEINPWYTAALGFGISLRLKAVQVIELVSVGDQNAEQFGFGEEDGFAASEAGMEDAFDSGDVAADDNEGDF